MENTLYYGDNLDILRRYIPDNSIDLIYLDPPFKSDQSYNILFKEKNGTESVAQIKAFEDTWHWDKNAEETYIEITENYPQKVADLIIALRSFLGSNDMMAYLVMMAIRLEELQRVLKETGSIYLHCDSTASHYLKLVMDSVFGAKNFKREIIWDISVLSGFKTVAKNWIRGHDTILFYTKNSSNFVFNKQSVPHREEYIRRFNKIDENGRRYFDGRGGKRYLDEAIEKGKAVGDVWSDIMSFQQIPTAKERLPYPTQKPEALLERIIKASSNKGDLILDPFCGCGTTIIVAEKLKRKWIGMDVTHLAISLMRHRLKGAFGDKIEFEVIGEPMDLKGAEALAKQDPYQFQWWALGLVGARPAESEQKKGGDKGVDGYIYFHDEPQKTKKIIIQVKSGHINRGMIDALKGVMENQNAQIGVFITLNHPTKGMRTDAISSGYYKSPGWNKNYPKMQILTIKELLEGKGIDYPPKTNITFKKAKKYTADEGEQLTIDKKSN